MVELTAADARGYLGRAEAGPHVLVTVTDTGAGIKPEVRRRLIARKGYTDAELPSQQTINTKLNMLGYSLSKVAKCRPQKESRRPMPSSSG